MGRKDSLDTWPQSDNLAPEIGPFDSKWQDVIVAAVRRDVSHERSIIETYVWLSFTALKAPDKNSLLRVKTVFRLIQYGRLRPVDHFICYLLTSMGG